MHFEYAFVYYLMVFLTYKYSKFIYNMNFVFDIWGITNEKLLLNHLNSINAGGNVSMGAGNADWLI